MKTKKNWIKLFLDILMLLTLVLMYNKRVISMSFHEIGGLCLLGAVLIHLLLNAKWVVGVTKKLFAKTTPVKTKIGYIVDALLLAALLLIIVSGAFISKVVFDFQVQGAWKTIHYFSAALCVVLLGVHMGLHTGFLGGMCRRMFPKVSKKASKPLAIVLTVLVFAFGVYSMTTTSFIRWLSMPFSVQQSEGEHAKPDFEENTPTAGEETTEEQPETTETRAKGQGKGARDGSGNGLRPKDGTGFGGGKGESQPFSIQTLLSVLGSFFSISFVFATVTALISKLLARKKKMRVINSASQQ